jgi:hypothetical protein
MVIFTVVFTAGVMYYVGQGDTTPRIEVENATYELIPDTSNVGNYISKGWNGALTYNPTTKEGFYDGDPYTLVLTDGVWHMEVIRNGVVTIIHPTKIVLP